MGAVGEWFRAVDWRPGRVVLRSNPAAATSLRSFDNSVYPALCLSEETLKAAVPSIWCLCQGK